MRTNFLRLFAGFCLLVLGACSAAVTVTPIPAVTAIQVELTPTLSNWLPKLNECSKALKSSNLVIETTLPSLLNYGTSDLVMRLGNKKDTETFLSVPGYERISLIQNQENPTGSITFEEFQQILAGGYSSWDELPSLKSQPDLSKLPIVLFSYGKDDDLTEWISTAFLENHSVRPDAREVFSSEDLIKSVENTPGSLGFMISAESQGHFSLLNIMDSNGQPMEWNLPVLAITNGEPIGDLRELLLCLQ